LKKKLKFISSIFLLTVLLSSCDKDLYEDAISTTKKTSVKEIKFSELLKNQKFKNLLEKVSENSAVSRTAFENQNGFTISNTNIKVIETDSITSYTMLIERDSNTNATIFENLVLQEDIFNHQKAAIFKYTLTDVNNSFDDSFSYAGTIQKTRVAFTGFNKVAQQTQHKVGVVCLC
jgi:PBP1b-binding outer membrane lipoprotein LpoB